MAKKNPKPNAFLALENMACRLGKFSNNLVTAQAEDEDGEDEEGSDEVGVFTFPVTELLLTEAQINTLWGDEHTHACWYDTSKGVANPMPWIGFLPEMGKNLPPGFRLDKKFENVELVIAYAESPNRNTQRDTFTGCKIGRVLSMPRPNTSGNTEVKFHLQVRPGLGEENLRLQEYQNRRVAISIVSAELVASKDAKQQQLALGAPGADSGETKSADEQFEADAKAQRDAWAAGRPVGGIPPADAPPPTTETH